MSERTTKTDRSNGKAAVGFRVCAPNLLLYTEDLCNYIVICATRLLHSIHRFRSTHESMIKRNLIDASTMDATKPSRRCLT